MTKKFSPPTQQTCQSLTNCQKLGVLCRKGNTRIGPIKLRVRGPKGPTGGGGHLERDRKGLRSTPMCCLADLFAFSHSQLIYLSTNCGANTPMTRRVHAYTARKSGGRANYAASTYEGHGVFPAQTRQLVNHFPDGLQLTRKSKIVSGLFSLAAKRFRCILQPNKFFDKQLTETDRPTRKDQRTAPRLHDPRSTFPGQFERWFQL